MSSHIFPMLMLLSRSYFSFFFDLLLLFPIFFLKISDYPYIFILKCHIHGKSRFFPLSLCSLKFHILSNVFFREHAAKHLIFLFLTSKGSLLSLYYSHVLGKAQISLLFHNFYPHFFPTFC